MVATLRSQPQNMAQTHGPVCLSPERSRKRDREGGREGGEINDGRKSCFTYFNLLLIEERKGN